MVLTFLNNSGLVSFSQLCVVITALFFYLRIALFV